MNRVVVLTVSTALASLSARHVRFTWDAENRLATVEPWSPETDERRTCFAYDYLGRRVRKWQEEWTGSAWDTAAPIADRRFVWDGWLMVEELYNAGSVGTPDWRPRRKYAWGLDLAGQNGAGGAGILPAVGGGPASSRSDLGRSDLGRSIAGGIGGLLAVEESFGTTSTGDDTRYLFCYDGNVGQLLDRADGGDGSTP